tara:strand:+ start:1461 stop:1661 length:201 start_codon:yes stop_codon:yes gene_type:complete
MEQQNPNPKQTEFDDDYYDGPSWEKRSKRRNARRNTKQDLRNLDWNDPDGLDYFEEEDNWEKFNGH